MANRDGVGLARGGKRRGRLSLTGVKEKSVRPCGVLLPKTGRLITFQICPRQGREPRRGRFGSERVGK